MAFQYGWKSDWPEEIKQIDRDISMLDECVRFFRNRLRHATNLDQAREFADDIVFYDEYRHDLDRRRRELYREYLRNNPT